MRSCATHRLAEIAVGLAILLLVALLAVLWSGSSGAVGRPGNATRPHPQQQLAGRDLLQTTRRDEPAPYSASTAEPVRNAHPDGYQDQTWGPWKGEILPVGKGDTERIVLAKANQNSYEDPLDEHSKAERHHSGHFRHSQHKVWDPHPQYEFTAFGRRFHLRLEEDSSFVPPGVTVTHIGENTTRRENPEQHLGCFYSGHVDGDPKSVVTVSLCHGMTGHLRTSTGNYLIRPTEQWSDSGRTPAIGSPLQHIIYRLSRSDPEVRHAGNLTDNDLPGSDAEAAVGRTHECGVIETDGQENSIGIATEDASDIAKTYVGDKKRRRRSASSEDDSYDGEARRYRHEGDRGSDLDIYGSWRTRRALPREYFIEIMVVADRKMIDYHGEGLTSYILVLMNTVSRIYKSPSIGNPISIALIKIKKADEVFGERHRGSDGISASEMLRTFCSWQKDNNPQEPSPEHHDTALLLTRENLCHSENRKCDTLGLAELGRMCSPGSSCTIVQDNGLATAFTIAHEIGHVLNMPHDDDMKCTRFGNPSRVRNIMSRMLDEDTDPWEWSKCSRHYVTEFFEADQGRCLLDKPRSNKIMSRSYGSRQPGEQYPEDKQCELVYGKNSMICPHMVGDDNPYNEQLIRRGLEDVCKRLWCTVPYWSYSNSSSCHTQQMPWADGTICGLDKWCQQGKCVSREDLEPVDGGWDAWSPYGECSRTCGGGIQKRYRECNSPAPQHGGNYCVGEHVEYRSCGTDECPPGSPDFREEQCSKFDNNNLNIPNLPKNVKWHAKYTRIQPEDRCKLYCQVAGNQYYMPRDKVIDGTPCGPDTFHVCVNGRCKPAGCDHVLNSSAALDTCGVCRGDNSTCQRITGSYNATEYGYTRITKIPAGSSYIDIRQYGWMGSHNDSNYLALRIKERGKYILNGNYMVMHRKVIVHPGIAIEYSGPEQVVERLNSSRPIHVDLILEVLSVGNVNPPQIVYEYTVPKKILNRYMWVLSGWTSCDRMCHGMEFRKAQCRGVESQDIMSDDYCPFEDKPREESRRCNTHCDLQWQEDPNSTSECSSHCGPGTMYVKHLCILVSRTTSRAHRLLQPHACDHLEPPRSHRPCIGPCDYAHWQYGEWSACSVSCGPNGLQYRSAVCVDREGRLVPEDKCPPSHTKIIRQSCPLKPCPKWAFSEWSPCSVSCGMGKRKRRHWCQVESRVVDHTRCSGIPAIVSESCDAGPCLVWHSGDWSQCSTSCGLGVSSRMVECKFTNGTLARGCDPTSRPASSRSCAAEPCPTKAPFVPITYSSNLPAEEPPHENDIDSHRITFRSGYRWVPEGVEECSKSCGGGVANQIVRCVSVETGKVAPSSDYCDAKRRPRSLLVACNEHACPTWTTGEWSQCDVKCGDGYQHRQVLCQDLRGEIMNDSDCSEKTKPRHAKKCQRGSCQPSKDNYNSHNLATYKWRTSAWSECSASCGNGVRRREVTCHRVNSFGWLDPSPTIGCSQSDKPISEQFCKIRGCSDKYYWEPGNWRKCSQPCGRKGRQTRRLFCHSREGNKRVRRRNCPANLKPQRKRKCNQRPCTGPTSCLEVKTRLKAYTDGEYILLVGGRYMSIYCHGMEGPEPLEYLTLPTGERENYAEIYDKRLRNPHSCPYDGRRNDSCECLTDSDRISGRTMFKRVRINVHTLHIMAGDFRYSMTIGKNNVEYGKAGDCYSQMECPQGRFGINLSGTYLMLAPDVHWPKQPMTHSVINRINSQHVIGKCGGYCGFCTPSPGLKLNVLPP